MNIPILEALVKEKWGESYSIESLSGSGGLRTTYKLTEEPYMNVTRALKVPKETLSVAMQSREDKLPAELRVEREGTIRTELEKSKGTPDTVVKIHRAGKLGDILFIEEEFIDGPDMAKCFKDFNLGDRLRIYGHMLEGVNYFHEDNYVVRDLKLDNFLFNKELKKATITDLEFLIKEGKEDGVTEFTELSFSHNSPEILRGEKFTKKSDMYRLGLCLYSLITEKGCMAKGDDREKILDFYKEKDKEEYNKELKIMLKEAKMVLKKNKIPKRRKVLETLEGLLQQSPEDRNDITKVKDTWGKIEEKLNLPYKNRFKKFFITSGAIVSLGAFAFWAGQHNFLKDELDDKDSSSSHYDTVFVDDTIWVENKDSVYQSLEEKFGISNIDRADSVIGTLNHYNVMGKKFTVAKKLLEDLDNMRKRLDSANITYRDDDLSLNIVRLGMFLNGEIVDYNIKKVGKLENKDFESLVNLYDGDLDEPDMGIVFEELMRLNGDKFFRRDFYSVEVKDSLIKVLKKASPTTMKLRREYDFFQTRTDYGDTRDGLVRKYADSNATKKEIERLTGIVNISFDTIYEQDKPITVLKHKSVDTSKAGFFKYKLVRDRAVGDEFFISYVVGRNIGLNYGEWEDNGSRKKEHQYFLKKAREKNPGRIDSWGSMNENQHYKVYRKTRR